MADGNSLKALWQGWSSRFAAMQPREKYMVVGALAIAIVFGGFSFWIEPGQQQAARLKKALVQQQSEQEQLNVQLAGLKSQNNDPDVANRLQLQLLRDQLTTTERDLKAFDRTLVAPSQASALLKTLLTRHRGLTLVSLNTLPPQPLIDPPAAKAAREGEKPATDTTGTTAEPMPGGNIYKHGIEIKLAGNYHDLLAYVSELESGPQKLLWGNLRLTVKKHPVSELTLIVYTLSLDSTWLIV
ncbi:MAG: hypothetical protein KKF85_07650 [Gammaproteobacteria bacterium]|nr:hypothetical protein [Rhodocyclaceae bacterium]MBU3910071.1 hypothetical protein [Gammaproteobacteria bacterium]MBU3988984.1 hypothetical protein [Gammaproteobacteria bacterium]MBU4003898.1 hypothetical protein [Gammaproteobacteria bacterium]MBU4022533.1 hypothetical protein [Gammaproteobacteria bacterium]